jgi:hypothetical protein
LLEMDRPVASWQLYCEPCSSTFSCCTKKESKRTHSSGSAVKLDLGFRYTRCSHSWGISGLFAPLGSLRWLWTAAWGRGRTHLAVLAQWAILGQISIWQFFPGLYTVYPLWAYLENLGAS